MNINKCFKIKASVVLLGSLFSFSASAAMTFSNYPLVGHAKLPPNVLLMLSVEFPTAKGVYQSYNFSTNDIKNTTYRGYFDPDLCYTYKLGSNLTAKGENGTFEPTSRATNHMCSGNNPEFSGNLLNAMTMTTIDIFRMTMSGGNRAKGAGIATADYTNGDTTTETYIRRAMVQPGKNQNEFLLNQKLIATANETRKMTPYAQKNLGFHNGPKGNYGHSFSMVVTPETDNNIPLLASGRRQVFNVNVRVCVNDASLREAHCVPYPNGYYKPEGLLQQYSKQMRFGVFGYLNNPTNHDGGVMRARLKLLAEDVSIPSRNSSNQYALGHEIDPNTGQFEINPDSRDATDSLVNNSGVINYLNKFGDASGYKTYDPVARLYYSGLRYLKGLPNPTAYTQYANATTRDNFPVITDWDDPLKRDADQGCTRDNVLLIIGDTNAHDQTGNNRVPSYSGSPFTDDATPYKTLTEQIANREGFGAHEGHALPMVGQAYAAFTRDLRPDLPKTQSAKKHTARTIGIDVVEYGDYKANGNAYYLASKYGGFDDINGDGWPGPDRSEWTDDAIGSSSIPQYPQGTPRNFSVGRDASGLDAALKSAFNSASKTPLAQAHVSTPVESGGIKDPNKPTLKIFTQYFADYWTGDIVGKSGSDTWYLSQTLNAQLAGNGWQTRKVFVRDGNTTKAFNSSSYPNLGAGIKNVLNADGNGLDRVNYILGDRSKEGASRDTNKPFRVRGGGSGGSPLLGTVINSPVAYLPGVTNEATILAGCQYANPASANRERSYAFAANDGMLHIIKSGNRTEQMAFLASSIFEPSVSDNTRTKAVQYSKKDYEHEYINDGVPVTKEMCFPDSGNNTIKSILVGTAGRGGHSVYAIDGTDLGNPSASNILWEFTNKNDVDLGLTVNTPILAYDHAKRPIAIISSGYNTPGNKTHIFVLRLDKTTSGWSKGTDYYKIEVGKHSVGLGDIEMVDTDKDGQPEILYAGDTEGRLWKIDTTNTDISQWGNKLGEALFTAKASDGSAQSIVAKPTYAKDGEENYIFFGTGRFFSAADTKLTKQSVYGIIDKNTPVSSSATLTVQKPVDMNTIGSTTSGGLLYNTTNNPLNSTFGWRFDLPDRFMVVDKVTYYKGSVFVPVFLPTEVTDVISANSSCVMGGKSGFLALTAKNGGMSNAALFDTNGDNLVDGNDTPAGLILFDSPSPAWSLLETENGLEFMTTDGSEIKGVVIDPLTKKELNIVKKLSWRIVS